MKFHQSMSKSKIGSSVVGLSMAILLFSLGCAEQPVGYIYEPDEGQIVDLAIIALDVLSLAYDQADEATGFLDAASLTSNYSLILPEGWQPLIDTTGGKIRPYYFKNYLDQKYNLMWFDENPIAGAVRTPSEIKYQFVHVGSLFNQITTSFYGDIVENRTITLEYSDNRQNPNTVNGWMNVTRKVRFVIIREIATQVGSVEYEDAYYENITWVIKVENFSVDPDDQSGTLIIDGTYPQVDVESIRHEHHVSGKVEFNRDGKGVLDLKIDGNSAFEIHLNGRQGYGFKIDEFILNERYEE